MSAAPNSLQVWAKIAETYEQNKVWVFVGKRGTGKTTGMLSLAVMRKAKSLIYTESTDKIFDKFRKVAAHRIETFKKGIATVSLKQLPPEILMSENVSSEIRYILNYVSEQFSDGVLILDDVNHILSFNLNRSLRSVVLNTRHQRIDVFLSFHSLNEIPKFLYGHINYLVLYKTSVEPETKLKTIENYDEIRDLYEKIQKSEHKYSFGLVTIA